MEAFVICLILTSTISVTISVLAILFAFDRISKRKGTIVIDITLFKILRIYVNINNALPNKNT